MKLVETFIEELKQETPATRKMLESVPQDALAWQPHENSRTLGEIAAHIANIPDVFASLKKDEFDRNKYQAPAADHVSDIVQTFGKSISSALELLQIIEASFLSIFGFFDRNWDAILERLNQSFAEAK